MPARGSWPTACSLALCCSLGCSESPATTGGPTVEPAPAPQPKQAPSPLASPAPAAASDAEPSAPPRAESLELTFVGDVVLGRYREHRGEAWFVEMQPPQSDPFAEVASLLAADVVVGNLESPIRREPPASYPVSERFRFATSAAHLAQLRRGGFTVMSLANNHFFDLGVEGQREGPQALTDSGLMAIGSARDEPPVLRVETLEVEGWRIGFLAFTTLRNHPGLAEGPQVPFVSLRHLRERAQPLIERARPDHDLLVVVAHWGTEYADDVRTSNKLAARHLIDDGVDLVIGHHPHVLQAIEHYGDGVIAYSLGNFMFPRGDPRPGLSGVLRIRYLDGPAPCLDEVRFHPAHLVRDPLWHPTASTGRRATQIRRRVADLSRKHGTRWITDDSSEDLVVESLPSCANRD